MSLYSGYREILSLFYSTNRGITLISEHHVVTMVADPVNRITHFQLDPNQHVIIYYTDKSYVIHKHNLVENTTTVSPWFSQSS